MSDEENQDGRSQRLKEKLHNPVSQSQHQFPLMNSFKCSKRINRTYSVGTYGQRKQVCLNEDGGERLCELLQSKKKKLST